MARLTRSIAWRAARFEFITSIAQLDELRRASHYPKFKAVLRFAYERRAADPTASRFAARIVKGT
jgi:predicted nucleic acid-binding protein